MTSAHLALVSLRLHLEQQQYVRGNVHRRGHSAALQPEWHFGHRGEKGRHKCCKHRSSCCLKRRRKWLRATRSDKNVLSKLRSFLVPENTLAQTLVRTDTLNPQSLNTFFLFKKQTLEVDLFIALIQVCLRKMFFQTTNAPVMMLPAPTPFNYFSFFDLIYGNHCSSDKRI